MKKPQTCNIGGHVIHVQCLPTRKAFQVERRLARGLAPAVGKLFGAASSVSDLARLDAGAIVEAIDVLFATMPEAEFDWLETTLLEVIMIDNKPAADVVDSVFQGEVWNYNQVLWFAIKVNFSDFGEGLRGVVAKLGGAAKKEPGSSSESTTPHILASA